MVSNTNIATLESPPDSTITTITKVEAQYFGSAEVSGAADEVIYDALNFISNTSGTK